MNDAQFADTLRKKFNRVDHVQAGAFRCERAHLGFVSGIYYFVPSNDLPTEESLLSYQDNLLSKDFFRSDGSVQWNYYLVFVLGRNVARSDSLEKQKAFIERDRNYARKFVIHDDELGDFLEFNPFSGEYDNVSQPDVVGIWKSRLEEKGLGRIVSRDSRKDVIREIASGNIASGRSASSRRQTDLGPEMSRFIEELRISRFRDFPEKRDFKFGSVNLIFGRNGCGKTTLLEAIEHFYCGATKRADKSSEGFDASIRFKGTDEFVSYEERPNTYYQARDLAWYGKTVPRGNSLPFSFSQYNFFNADAAYNLEALSKGDEKLLEGAFAELALGPEANTLWQRMVSFEEDIADQVQHAEKAINELNENQQSDEKLLSEQQQATPNLDALFLALLETLKVTGWKKLPSDIAEASGSFMRDWYECVPPLNALDPINPILKLSFNDVLALKASLTSLEELVTSQKKVIESNRASIVNLEESIKRKNERLEVTKRLAGYLNSSFVKTIKAHEEQALLVAQRHKIVPLAEKDRAILLNLPATEAGSTVLQRLKATSLKLSSDLSTMKVQIESIETTSKELKQTLAQVRALGLKVISASDARMIDCPLCSTEFIRTDLEKSLKGELKADAESALFAQLKGDYASGLIEKEKLTRSIVILETLIETLKKIAPPKLTDGKVLEMLELLDSYAEETSVLASKFADLGRTMQALQEQGFSKSEWQKLLQVIQTDTDFISIQDVNEDAIKRVSEEMVSGLSKDAEAIVKLKQSIVETEQNLIASLKATNQLSGNSVSDLISALGRKILDYGGMLRVFEKTEKYMQLSKDVSSGVIRDKVLAANQVATELSMAISQQNSRSAALADLNERIQKRSVDLAKRKNELDHLSKALVELRALISGHSKEGALSGFIARNRKRINDIFVRIHAPREFLGLASSGLHLVRARNNKPASLSEVSTGQRSAVALSTFFSLNFNLSSAPPIVLIDDPVAHVDDLNALSFLDFIRELAATGRRQIFFATADDKMAALFKRKFSFLGNEFRTEVLTRSPTLVSEPISPLLM